MAYMDQERKATIAANLKPVFKKYGVKASLAVRHHSTIVVNIKSGGIDFIGNYNETVGKKCDQFGNKHNPAKDHIDVNPYWYQEHFTGVAKDFFDEVMAAVKSADWFDKSDIQTDYFNTAYYFDINVGRWDKAYELVA
jgi:hypothetical protein